VNAGHDLPPWACWWRRARGGAGVRRSEEDARGLLCQVVSAVSLFNFPIGTTLGGDILVDIGKVQGESR